MGKRSLPQEERKRIEAEILHSLWHEGASSLNMLITRLGFRGSEIEECLRELIVKDCVFRLRESPEDAGLSVFYLTERASKAFDAAVRNSSRYRMKRLWEGMKREESGLPKITSNS